MTVENWAWFDRVELANRPIVIGNLPQQTRQTTEIKGFGSGFGPVAWGQKTETNTLTDHSRLQNCILR